ncbi:hypothetical protein HX63_004687 [Salmonella enterica subsp. enterica]|nr:hypothetical protein [Salmonella enterica subsp. enterica serovar Poona]EDV3322492.1 hypothetical protein [Salmonella enterica subsp. enterica serovar Poona]
MASPIFPIGDVGDIGASNRTCGAGDAGHDASGVEDRSNPSAAIVQSASDVQCSRLLKTTCRTSPKLRDRLPPCPFPGVFLSRVLVA